ncbi:hypothetical protein LTR29_016013 [Friedmanniomyces endolithicus]|uniref:Uncharacterized protein n=1 Tax=Friedmanniomyces endolithicus TaxID=329885 RepID=A0A4U0TSE8_9PEZI|nr:hypothetical protein LTR29_016013 [Friedmanniomyces endolithicus]TKA25141.1 hypothetical protein B0A54_17320 [Friedmanniomyces endolithicus]
MASAASEATSLLRSDFPASTKPPKPSRSVTFNPQVSTSSRRAENPAFPRQPPTEDSTSTFNGMLSNYSAIDGFLNWQAWPAETDTNLTATVDVEFKAA